MTISELGARASAHELTVIWPEYFAYVNRERERQAEKERHQRRGRR